MIKFSEWIRAHLQPNYGWLDSMKIPQDYIKRMKFFHQTPLKINALEFEGFSWNTDDAHLERIRESLTEWYENKYLWTPCEGWTVYKFKQIPKIKLNYSLYACDALHLRHYFYSKTPLQEHLKEFVCTQVPLCLYLKYTGEIFNFNEKPLEKLNQLIQMQNERMDLIKISDYTITSEWNDFAKQMQSKFTNQFDYELSTFIMN